MTSHSTGRPTTDRDDGPVGGRGATLAIGISFLVAFAAGIVLLGVYVLGGETQVEGVLLFLCLGGIGFGVVVWSQRLLPDDFQVVPRHVIEASRRREAQRPAEAAIGRRTFLRRMLALAFTGLAAALAIPVFSLGPAPGRSLFETPWRRGRRLVSIDGHAVNASALPVGSMTTVFPEGSPGSADGQTLLIHVEPELLRLPGERGSWAPEGFVAYSKLCTHAGCPVGLYLTDEHRLLCPCHQSTFDVLTGAVPVFGPAARPLPQLPIQLQPDGTFEALDDFDEPVGPSFWNVHADG